MAKSVRHVLVTGADGFIGSHLTEHLLKSGHKVRALSLYNSFNSWGWLEDIHQPQDNLEVISGDIRDPHFCIEITRDVDWVFNLAALIGIPYSYQSPHSYIETNIMGTYNICHALKLHGRGELIQTSTSEVYGTARTLPISESHPKQPQSPYSASKIGADAMALSYFYAFNLPVKIARPFNTYGPRQSARAVIPTVITQLLEGKKELRLGDLSPKRDFTFVTDTCRGLLAIAECPAMVGQEANLGAGTDISIGDLVGLIADIVGAQVTIVEDASRLRPEKSEVLHLLSDYSKVQELAGYSPKYSLKEGLTETVAWFKDPAHRARYKAGIYNV